MPKRLKQPGVSAFPKKDKPWEPDTAPPHGDPFKDMLSVYMSKLGAKGGKVSGAKRMQMPKRQRVEIARKAAAARWARKNRPAQS
jgi:hypothetical protein